MKKTNKILITIGIIFMILGVLSDPSSPILLGVGAGLIVISIWKDFED
jgi:small-conductance mechanosensitive channel